MPVAQIQSLECRLLFFATTYRVDSNQTLHILVDAPYVDVKRDLSAYLITKKGWASSGWTSDQVSVTTQIALRRVKNVRYEFNQIPGLEDGKGQDDGTPHLRTSVGGDFRGDAGQYTIAVSGSISADFTGLSDARQIEGDDSAYGEFDFTGSTRAVDFLYANNTVTVRDRQTQRLWASYPYSPGLNMEVGGSGFADRLSDSVPSGYKKDEYAAEVVAARDFRGNGGNDTIVVKDALDWVDGGKGNDTITGDAAGIEGGSGADVIRCYRSDALVVSGRGTDQVSGAADLDWRLSCNLTGSILRVSNACQSTSIRLVGESIVVSGYVQKTFQLNDLSNLTMSVSDELSCDPVPLSQVKKVAINFDDTNHQHDFGVETTHDISTELPLPTYFIGNASFTHITCHDHRDYFAPNTSYLRISCPERTLVADYSSFDKPYDGSINYVNRVDTNVEIIGTRFSDTINWRRDFFITLNAYLQTTDVIRGGDGDDEIYAEVDSIFGGNGDDTLSSSAGYLAGENGDDVFTVSSATVCGGAGNDYITSTYLPPQNPYDPDLNPYGEKELSVSISYADHTQPVYVNLDGNVKGGSVGERDVYVGVNFNSVEGGSGNDTILGSASHNWIDGMDGNDLIYGGDGDDYLRGGSGRDTIYGQGGDDDYDATDRQPDLLRDLRGTAAKITLSSFDPIDSLVNLTLYSQWG